MSLNVPDFRTASYATSTESDSTFSVPDPTSTHEGSILLARSIAFGLCGAVLGAVLYGGFIHLTHINVGYLAIVVAYLVAKGMMMGSDERGGRPFQISAVILTCLSVAMGNAFMLYLSLHKDTPVHVTPWNLLQLLRFGFMEPLYEFQDSTAGALLTLFILFLGLRAAWRMTSGLPGAVRHPFSRGF